MNKQQQNRLHALLRGAMAPVECSSDVPDDDLWPALKARLSLEPDSEPVPNLSGAQVPWFDWALTGALAAFVGAFPATIPMLLYYL